MIENSKHIGTADELHFFNLISQIFGEPKFALSFVEKTGQVAEYSMLGALIYSKNQEQNSDWLDTGKVSSGFLLAKGVKTNHLLEAASVEPYNFVYHKIYISEILEFAEKEKDYVFNRNSEQMIISYLFRSNPRAGIVFSNIVSNPSVKESYIKFLQPSKDTSDPFCSKAANGEIHADENLISSSLKSQNSNFQLSKEDSAFLAELCRPAPPTVDTEALSIINPLTGLPRFPLLSGRTRFESYLFGEKIPPDRTWFGIALAPFLSGRVPNPDVDWMYAAADLVQILPNGELKTMLLIGL
jgi:hypothetical protein